MVKLTDEQKKLFYSGGNFFYYVFYFPEIDLEITNETIHQESVTLTEAVCEGDEFALGGCISSSLEFEVSEIMDIDITGLEFSATLYVNKDGDNYDLKLPMGSYRVLTALQVDDKDYKKVTAYDALYDASIDVSEWYESYFPEEDTTHTLAEVRISLLEYLGLSYKKQTLLNDDVVIRKGIQAGNGLTGTGVLEMICVIHGGYGKINRDGLFEVTDTIGPALFPEETLYPSEDLYPEDTFEYLGQNDEDGVYPEYIETKYEEYHTDMITCVNIRTTDDDVGVTYGDDTSNPYLITGNFLLYGLDTDTLNIIAKNILSRIADITYIPNETTLTGLPYMETGDFFGLDKAKDYVESYIFSRTLTGIHAMRDKYVSKGGKVRENEVTANEEIMQLKGRTLTLKKSVDEVSAEIYDFEDDTSTKFEMTNGQIVMKVDSKGKIAQVELGKSADKGTEFLVSADNISMTAEESISFMAGGDIDLTGKNISITSDNFSVDKDGKVNASDLNITGGTINVNDVFDVSEKGHVTATSIDISDGSFSLQDGKLEIATTNFILDSDGNVTANSLSITGGDINVNDKFIVDSSGNVTAKSIDISQENEKGENIGAFTFKDGAVSIDTDKFTLDSDGSVTASSLSITGGDINVNDKFIVDSGGNVTAKSIDIDGGTIDVGGNFSVTSAGHVTANSIDINGGSFTLKDNKIEIETDNFTVDSSGNVTAKSIDITHVDKDGNEDGAFSFTDGEVSISTPNFTLDTDGSISASNLNITGGEITLGDNFHVDSDGNLTCAALTSEVARAKNEESSLSSSIQQNAEEIVLKVDGEGNMVEVALGVSADDSSKTIFTVDADNISLSADDVFDIMSGGTLNLSSKKLNIESSNFSVDSDGKVTANSIDITGGSVNIITSNSSVDSIELNNVDAEITTSDGKEIKVSVCGNGYPSAGSSKDMASGEYYLDVDTMKVYLLEEWVGSIPKFKNVTTKTSSSVYIHSTKLNTDNGVSVSESEWTSNKWVNGYECDMSPYKITLVAKQQYPNGTIGTDEINLTTENIDVDLTAQTMDTALSIDKEIIPKGIRFSGVTSSNVSYDTKIYDDGEGKLGILSKGIVINNCELIQGTVIWDIGDQSRATITKVPMNIPKIASGMPCGACVGDYEATPEMYVAGCSVDPTNEYMYIFTGYYGSANYTRARFNYWCWVTVD